MNQNNRNNCSCEKFRQADTSSYGRTPWGSREGCGCGRRPWNACGTSCQNASFGARNAANTTWKNRSEGCGCAIPSSRAGSCTEETAEKSGCACGKSPRSEEGCSCRSGSENGCLLEGQSLAMVYSPYQKFDSLYDPRRGLCNGTIFTDLDKPFRGDGRCL